MDRTAWIVVTICVVLLGLQWTMNEPQETPADPPAATAPADPAAPAAQPASPAEPAAQPAAPATPADGAAEAAAPAAQPADPAASAPAAAKPAQEIAVIDSKDAAGNVVAKYHFQDVGGSISGVEMVGKAINSMKPELQQNVRINSDPDHGIGTLMFGLSADRPATFDTAVYHVVAQDARSITLAARVGELDIHKTYTLKPLKQGEQTIDGNAYAFDLKIDVRNASSQAMEAKGWGLYAGGACQLSDDEFTRYTYYVTQDNGEFDKESAGSFSGMFSGTKARICTNEFKSLEWAGVMNQYYASVIQPAKDSGNGGIYAAPANFKMPVTGAMSEDGVQLAVGLPDFTLSPSAGKGLSFQVFTGPKLNLMLSDMNDEFRKLDRLMDYGILTFLSYPMNWLINLFYGWFGNWGWAIVAMTFVVRGIIWPLYRKSYMSMKRMSLLQPKMKELKEKYPDDQQKVQMEMMKLYQEYGISPMGGCLPMMLQIPIFFAFFYVLQTAAEFRGAEWIGWVTDLSQMDTVCWLPIGSYNLPINVLPILMAVSMIVQMHMTPATGDATQVKIMRWMPAVFFLFCYTYASALALYWTTTNIISIIQTLIIRRLPQPELTKVKHKGGGKKGFMQRMMDAQQQALQEQQRRARK